MRIQSNFVKLLSSSSQAWKNCTDRSFLDAQKIVKYLVLAVAQDMVFSTSSLHHIFLLQPLLTASDGLLLRIRFCLRPLNTFVFDENIFFLDFLGPQHGSSEHLKTLKMDLLWVTPLEFGIFWESKRTENTPNWFLGLLRCLAPHCY